MPLDVQFSLAFLDGYHEDLPAEALAHWRRVRAHLLLLEGAHGPIERMSWPEKLTPELRHILSLQGRQTASVAQAYRKIGEFVEEGDRPLWPCAEHEQAFMLHKLIAFWIDHGDGWREAARKDLERVTNAVKAPSNGAPA